MDAAGLNKPSYSKKQIFEGSKHLKKLKGINQAFELTAKTKEVGDLFNSTINSMGQMISAWQTKIQANNSTTKKNGIPQTNSTYCGTCKKNVSDTTGHILRPNE